MVAVFRLTALAGVAAAAQTVQGQCNGLVGFAAQGTVAHGGPLEALDDGGHRLHLVQRDAAVRVKVEVQQAAQVDPVLLGEPTVVVVHGFPEQVVLVNCLKAPPSSLVQQAFWNRWMVWGMNMGVPIFQPLRNLL